MRVLKWAVAVDDEWHEIGTGEVVLVAPFNSDAEWHSLEARAVNVWTLEPDADDPMRAVTERMMTSKVGRIARVYGTGMEFPGDHLGSCVDGRFVWHVAGLRTREDRA